MEIASKVKLREDHFQIMAITIIHDFASKGYLRSIAVKCFDQSPLFIWEGMCLQWAEAQREIN